MSNQSCEDKNLIERAQKILSDKRYVTQPGCGYLLVKIPGTGKTVGGHGRGLLYNVVQVLREHSKKDPSLDLNQQAV